MKTTVAVFVLIFSCFCMYGQSSEVKKMLKEIEGKWSLDDNRNVTYQRIVEVPDMKKDDIYNRVLNYFVYNYGSGKSVIQAQDKELGQIIGKGIYDRIYTSDDGFGLVHLGTWHIIRVEVKDGKARIIITLTEYSEDFNGSLSSINVSYEFPINKDGPRKNIMGKSFYRSHIKAMASLDLIEKAIKEGTTSKKLEDNKW